MLDTKRTIIALAMIASIVVIILFGKETMPAVVAASAGGFIAAALAMIQSIWKSSGEKTEAKIEKAVDKAEAKAEAKADAIDAKEMAK